MKNIFKLIAIFAIAMSGFAFGQTDIKAAQTAAKEAGLTIATKTAATADTYKSAMVDLVNVTKSSYTKGMTYETFAQTCTGLPPGGFTAQEAALMKEVYGYVSKGLTDSAVYSATTGTAVVDAAKSRAFQGQTIANQSGKIICGNIGCWIVVIIKIVMVLGGYL